MSNSFYLFLQSVLTQLILKTAILSFAIAKDLAAFILRRLKPILLKNAYLEKNNFLIKHIHWIYPAL
jgi:hypothetical protein